MEYYYYCKSHLISIKHYLSDDAKIFPTKPDATSASLQTFLHPNIQVSHDILLLVPSYTIKKCVTNKLNNPHRIILSHAFAVPLYLVVQLAEIGVVII